MCNHENNLFETGIVAAMKSLCGKDRCGLFFLLIGSLFFLFFVFLIHFVWGSTSFPWRYFRWWYNSITTYLPVWQLISERLTRNSWFALARKVAFKFLSALSAADPGGALSRSSWTGRRAAASAASKLRYSQMQRRSETPDKILQRLTARREREEERGAVG